ncbi:PilZ domain-containing protein [Marinobacter bryozoorum]|uniref:PilZ domain-containing protein n=1 Tax=Marinobacter bryozoorum TaxID=256324 RepID=UPI002003C4FC|nr:PilZ domain-containing protein [Marinobacter bryozoorum]MCK7543366.1 PilZ domain-containing protein [Marinobacter bryozoorum]
MSMMTMRSYSEKRDFHRMQVNSEIQITDGDGRSYSGICRDLSGTGMQLQVAECVPEGTLLHTVLPASSDDFPPFETEVRVLRSEPSGDVFLLGVAIEKVRH